MILLLSGLTLNLKILAFQLDNSQIVALILKEDATLEKCLELKMKERSPVIKIAKSLYGNDYRSKANSLLSRISSKKFFNEWSRLTVIGFQGTPHASACSPSSDFQTRSKSCGAAFNSDFLAPDHLSE